ncbi:MAG: HAD-IA family hydrolase, partial [Alphaproteobacteria bacterium]|nr:HAD-IA family hydrolase [Alphaproteobacteria bacterium]
NGLAPPQPRNVRGVVGLPLLDALDRLAPDGADLERLRDDYSQAYRELIADPAMHEPLYEGAIDALNALEGAGVLLGVATGKGRSGLHRVLERHGIRDRFVTLKTSDDGPGKPNPHMLISAMEEAGSTPAETVMIGDTTFDVLMASNAGVATIGVSWGYHDKSELRAAGASELVSTFIEVAPAFERLTGGS